MKVFKLIILSILFLNIKLSANTNEILWLQNQRPPWMINSGEYKDQGYGDKIRKLFISKLPNYSHKTIPINSARMMIEIKKRNNICYGPIAKFKSLDSLFHWSKPIYYLPRPAIIVSNETFKKLGSPKELSIIELIKNQNYRFGNHINILFYPIDIEKYSSQNNVTSISTTSPTSSLFNMLQKKRIDWMYDSTVFVKWQIFTNNSYKDFKTIKDIESKHLPAFEGHIACSKNKWGQKVIDKINKNINRENILKIRSYVRKWQLDDANLKEYDKVNYQLFGY